MSNGPIMFDMTSAATASQIGEVVRFDISRQTKFPKRCNMRDGELLCHFIFRDPAIYAAIVVSIARQVALQLPIWPVIFALSALPMWTLIPPKFRRKPFKPAFIAAKLFARRGGLNSPQRSACDTSISNARLLKVRITLPAAKALPFPRWRDRKCSFTSRTNLQNPHLSNDVASR
jgi:hypothetical protein